jgi:hypothetical protein
MELNELLLEKEVKEEETRKTVEENLSLKAIQERLRQREEILKILKEESEKEIGTNERIYIYIYMYVCIL